jgi:hypothetical protein
MTAEKYAARGLSSHGRNCRSESLLVAFCAAARWRPVRSCLAKGKIAAEHNQSRGRKLICQFYQKRNVAVCSCAVGQDEAGLYSNLGPELRPNWLGGGGILERVLHSWWYPRTLESCPWLKACPVEMASIIFQCEQFHSHRVNQRESPSAAFFPFGLFRCAFSFGGTAAKRPRSPSSRVG